MASDADATLFRETRGSKEMNRTDISAENAALDSVTHVADVNDIPTIPIIEEQVRIGKQTAEVGRVRISKHVTERVEAVDVLLHRENVEIERIPVNRYVETAPPVRHEGDTMIIPVLREVIEKRLLVIEELRVTKRTTQEHAVQQMPLRKEELVVERIPSDKP